MVGNLCWCHGPPQPAADRWGGSPESNFSRCQCLFPWLAVCPGGRDGFGVRKLQHQECSTPREFMADFEMQPSAIPRETSPTGAMLLIRPLGTLACRLEGPGRWGRSLQPQSELTECTSLTISLMCRRRACRSTNRALLARVGFSAGCLQLICKLSARRPLLGIRGTT